VLKYIYVLNNRVVIEDMMLKVTSIKLIVCMLLLQCLSACSTTPEKKEEYVFYPPLPSPPRIQYLTSLSGPADLINDESAFSRFVLGDDKQDDAGVKKPYGVSIKDGIIYLVDIRGSGYAMFDLKQNKFDMVHGSFSGKMNKPINIFVDDDGSRFVTDTIRNVVIVFDKNDEFVKVIGDGKSFKPADILIVDERLFISDIKNHIIQVYDKDTDKKLYTIGKVGSSEGELFFPANMTLSPDNHLYISETGNFRIQEFTLDGEFIRSMGKVGTGVGQFARPKGISIDRDGNIYVVDAAFQNIQIISKEGEMLMFFGEPGGRKDNINLPADVLVDYDHVSYFQKYAKPGFKLEYILLVTSQFGASKLNVFGYGQMDGVDYSSSKPDEVIQ